MADDGDDIERNGEQGTQESAPRDDVAVTLMGTVLEKLRILHYEREMNKKKNYTPYTETQFAYLTNNASAQFKSFLELVVFLMKQCNQEFVVDKYDDPNTSVNKLILILKVMGFPLDFPASKLKTGYGEAVCAALSFLCDQALTARQFTYARPLYPKEDFADEAEVDEDAEVDGNEEPASAHAVEEEEELYSEMVRTKVTEASALEESFQQMIISEVDPLLWKTEVERVGPKLKVNIASNDENGKEWHSHIERTRKHEMVMKELLPRVSPSLIQLGTQLKEINERMMYKEKQIHHQYEVLCQEYHQIKEKWMSFSEQCKVQSDKVHGMTSAYTTISDQVRETKDVMDAKGSKMTDTTPLVAIKEALKTLNMEIKNFELRIGVVGHTLLQAKAKQAAAVMRRKGGGRQVPEYENSDEDSN